MYIYFHAIKCVITCEEYPRVITVEEMKTKQLEHLCNKWEKINTTENLFTLSFKHEKYTCNCENIIKSQPVVFDECLTIEEIFGDYKETLCHGCKLSKIAREGENLYLQNSGHMDIVCVFAGRKVSQLDQLTEVSDYPNVYRWNSDEKTPMFSLHVNENNMLSDYDISKNIDKIKDYCLISFVDNL